MGVTERDRMIPTVSPDRADGPCDASVLPGRTWRGGLIRSASAEVSDLCVDVRFGLGAGMGDGAFLGITDLLRILPQGA